MAQVVRNPLVTDYIVELDAGSEDGCAEARQRYEEGFLVLLRGGRFALDYPFLNSLDFDVDGPAEIVGQLKKFGSHKIAAIKPSGPGELDQFVFNRVFGCDAGKLAYFQEQIESGDRQADDLYARIFPNYVATRAMHTWRFTSTLFENLHWDNFGIPQEFHQVRIFTNLASSPRLWRTSHRIEDFADSTYDQYSLADFAGKSGDDLNRFLNKAALGGMKRRCLDGLPKHHIAFEQGDVWLCETRIVAHQIYQGSRAFAAMYFSDPLSADNPELTFDARIARLHENRRAATATAELRGTAN